MLEGSTGVHHINHCLVISAQNILFSVLRFMHHFCIPVQMVTVDASLLSRLNTTEMQKLELL